MIEGERARDGCGIDGQIGEASTIIPDGQGRDGVDDIAAAPRGAADTSKSGETTVLIVEVGDVVAEADVEVGGRTVGITIVALGIGHAAGLRVAVAVADQRAVIVAQHAVALPKFGRCDRPLHIGDAGFIEGRGSAWNAFETGTG